MRKATPTPPGYPFKHPLGGVLSPLQRHRGLGGGYSTDFSDESKNEQCRNLVEVKIVTPDYSEIAPICVIIQVLLGLSKPQKAWKTVPQNMAPPDVRAAIDVEMERDG